MVVERSAFRKVAAVMERQRRARYPCPEPDCSGRLVLRRGNGRFFWGCDRYPDCRGSRPADQKTGKAILFVSRTYQGIGQTPRRKRGSVVQQPEKNTVDQAVSFREWEDAIRPRRRVILEQE